MACREGQATEAKLTPSVGKVVTVIGADTVMQLVENLSDNTAGMGGALLRSVTCKQLESEQGEKLRSKPQCT